MHEALIDDICIQYDYDCDFESDDDAVSAVSDESTPDVDKGEGCGRHGGFGDPPEDVSMEADTNGTPVEEDEHDEYWTDLNNEASDTAKVKISVSHEATANLRAKSWPDIHTRVLKVLDCMKKEGINTQLFLDALCWGTPACTSHTDIKNARTSFMTSEELPQIIQRWWKPLRSQKSKKSRARAATNLMEEFALECVSDVREREMAALSSKLQVGANSFVEKNLTTVKLENVIDDMKELAPTLWDLLYGAGHSKNQEQRGTKKNPDKIVMMAISMLSYARNQNCNVLQKLFAMYFKFNKISERAYDALHGLGITMSSTWTSKNIERAANHAMQMVVHAILLHAWLMSHDNVNIPFEVYSQRLNNRSHFDSGTAATVFVLPHISLLPPDIAHALRRQRLIQDRPMITIRDVITHEMRLSKALVPFLIQRILHYLLQTPEMQAYPHRNSPIFQFPASLHKLPWGPAYVTHQFILHTKHIEEASYEGNARLIIEWLKQLCLDAPDEQRHTALERIIAFVGDQLTASRLRGLFTARAEDVNSYERLDYLVPIFGWLHLLMAFANSLHKQYVGIASGHSLTQAFVLLNKRGLTQVSTKGPFYHDLCEALEHVLEAHIRSCWLVAAGVSSISDLNSFAPQQLMGIAHTIYNDYASRVALDRMDALPIAQKDQEQRNTCSMIRDLLHFSVLRINGVKEGDVGIMEAMLPYLLFRFVGGGNSNYSTEILELMQGLWIEWPSEFADFVRSACWLVNFSGERDSFLPIDLAQEHNIRDIKVTYRPDGPSNGWDYLHKVSPAIPAIREVSEHVSKEMKTLSRGKKHTVPSKEADVQKLLSSYTETEVHRFGRDRKRAGNTVVMRDFVAEGFLKLQTSKMLEEWRRSRCPYRSDEQVWSDSSSESGD